MANIVVQDVFAVINTASQDLIISAFGGGIPKAAIIVLRGDSNNEQHDGDARWSWGFIDDTGEQGTHGSNESDAQTSMNTAIAQVSNGVVACPNPDGTSFTRLFSGQLITNGIRLTRTNAGPSVALLILFGGDDIQVKVVSFHNMDTAAISSLSFQPNAFFCIGSGQLSGTTTTQNAILSIGAGVTTAKQDRERLVSYRARDGLTTADCAADYRNTAFTGRLSTTSAAYDWLAQDHVFTSNGMTWTNSASPSSNVATFLFLRVEEEQVGIFDFDYPSATGQWLSEAHTFTPKVGVLAGISIVDGSNVSAVNNFAVTAAMFDANSVSSMGIRSQDAIGTSATGSNSSTSRFQGMAWNSDTPNLYANIVGVSPNDEWEMNVTTLNSAYASPQWVLSIGVLPPPVGGVRIGDLAIDALFLGAAAVDVVYQGIEKVWPSFVYDTQGLIVHGLFTEGSGLISPDKADIGVNWSVGGTWGSDMATPVSGFGVRSVTGRDSITRPFWPGVLNDPNFDSTVTAWVKIDNGSLFQCRFCTSNTAPSDVYGGHMIRLPTATNNTFFIQLGDGRGNTTSNRKTYNFNTAATLYDDGLWHHVALTVTGSIFGALYLDGVLMPSFSAQSGSSTGMGWSGLATDQFVSNSSWGNTTSNYLWGEIADWRIYDEVLSQPRIESIAQGLS